jgi:hypothetical protein
VHRSEVENGVAPPNGTCREDRVTHVADHDLDVASYAAEVVADTAGEVIGDRDLGAGFQQQLDQVAPDERGTARDEYAFAIVRDLWRLTSSCVHKTPSPPPLPPACSREAHCCENGR